MSPTGLRHLRDMKTSGRHGALQYFWNDALSLLRKHWASAEYIKLCEWKQWPREEYIQHYVKVSNEGVKSI